MEQPQEKKKKDVYIEWTWTSLEFKSVKIKYSVGEVVEKTGEELL